MKKKTKVLIALVVFIALSAIVCAAGALSLGLDSENAVNEKVLSKVFDYKKLKDQEKVFIGAGAGGIVLFSVAFYFARKNMKSEI